MTTFVPDSKLVELFLQVGREQFETIVKAVDSESIAAAAHTLKGSALCLKLSALATICAEIEEFGRAHQFANAASILPKLRDEFERACEMLCQSETSSMS